MTDTLRAGAPDASDIVEDFAASAAAGIADDADDPADHESPADAGESQTEDADPDVAAISDDDGDPSPDAENVIRMNRYRDGLPRPAERINSAYLLGPGECAEFATLMGTEAVFLTARGKESKQWLRVPQPWSHQIEGKRATIGAPVWGLSRHTRSRRKDGVAIVLGESVEGARTAKSMKTMHAIGLDIDHGNLAATIERIQALGICAIVYTTYSYGTTKLELKRDDVLKKLSTMHEPSLAEVREYLLQHDKNRYDEGFVAAVRITNPKMQTKRGVVIVLETPPQQKFRLIFPLLKPVEIISLTQPHDDALKIWEDKVTGLAVNLLEVHFDTSCTDPSRLFYTPRHPEGADYYCAIIRGQPVDFEKIEPYPKSRYARDRQANPFTAAAGDDAGRAPACSTPSGRSLNDWHSRYGKDRFLMADLLEAYCVDKVRVAGGEKQGTVHTECPFEHEHTSEGGTATMAMNCLDNENGFWTWFCHHDACQGRHKLEFLQEALRAEWFSEDVLHDETFLLPPADGEEDESAEGQDGGSGDCADSQTEFETGWLPPRYKVENGQIILWEIGGGDKPFPLTVCGKFDVVGVSADADGMSGLGIIISFRNRIGKRVELTLNSADLHSDPRAVLRRLADAGLYIEPGKPLLIDLLNRIDPKRVIYTDHTPGWVRDQDGVPIGFMLPSGELVQDGTAHVRRLHETVRMKVTRPHGTLEGWRGVVSAIESVGESCPHLLAGLCAGFAGPVLEILGDLPVGFSFSGRTSAGKTTALGLAASVFSSVEPGDGLLHGGRATTNAIEDLALRSSGAVLAIDELGAMPNKSDLDALLFALNTGRTKARKSGSARGLVEGFSFRPFILMSNEKNLKAAVEGAGGEYRKGMSPRFPDIDVTGAPLLDADWCKQRIDEPLKEHYGHAAPVYVRHLLTQGIARDSARLGREVEAIAAELAGANAGSALRRTARVFAIAQRAGELAVDAGLLSDRDAVRDAIQRIWDTFKGSVEGGLVRDDEALLDAIRTFLKRTIGRTIIEGGKKDAPDNYEARGDVIGYHTDGLIILFWTEIEKVIKAAGLPCTRAEFWRALEKAEALDMKKKGRDPAHDSLPADVCGGRVKNIRILRGKLDI